MHQMPYAEKISVVEKGSNFEVFRSHSHELGWITHNLPDVAGDSALLAQVTKESFKPLHIQQIYKAIKRMKKDPGIGLKVHKLEMESLRIIAFSDTSFANTSNFRTQLGFVIFLGDARNRVNSLNFR